MNNYGGFGIGNYSGVEVEVFYAQRCPIVNLAEDEYQITGSSLDVYFFDETEDVPYIDLKGFIKSFDGFFESQNITLESNYDSTVWRLTYGESHSVYFDCAENKITAASYLEFYWFPVAGSSSSLIVFSAPAVSVDSVAKDGIPTEGEKLFIRAKRLA